MEREPAPQNALDPIFIVAFLLDERRHGLRLSAVERTVRMVAVAPLPRAPEIVLGILNFEGSIAPLIDLRRRLRLPTRELRPSDHLILARTRRRKVALAVDAAEGVELIAPEDWLSPETLPPPADGLAGVVRRPDGLILIHDLDAFLSLDEERALDTALKSEPEGAAS